MSPFRVALVAALAAHVGIAAWTVRIARLRAEAAVPSPAASTTEMEVLVEPSPAPSPATADEAPSESEPSRLARADLRPAAAREVAGAPAESAAAEVPSAEASGDGSWSFNPSGSASATGPLSGVALGNAVQAGIGATLAQDRAKDDSSAHVLRVFTAKEMSLGLVPGGAWVNLTRDRVRRSLAPDTSTALLEFTTDSAGVVASVRVLDASSGRSEWNDIAAQLAREARALPVHVPTGAGGVAVTMEVTSRIRTVSGEDPSRGTIGKVFRAIQDPVDTVIDSKTPAQRVVAAHITNVSVL
jgi:hypothetical protein